MKSGVETSAKAVAGDVAALRPGVMTAREEAPRVSSGSGGTVERIVHSLTRQANDLMTSRIGWRTRGSAGSPALAQCFRTWSSTRRCCSMDAGVGGWARGLPMLDGGAAKGIRFHKVVLSCRKPLPNPLSKRTAFTWDCAPLEVR